MLKKVGNAVKCDLKVNFGPQPLLHFLTDFSLDCISRKVSRSSLRICKCVGCVVIFGCEICDFVFSNAREMVKLVFDDRF